ncbi:hypothetical protein [Shewanella algae]|uniref:hypothetical protein n=1 Tax=Shewanella algae TaxID=38313 RepID=UPI003D048BDC
MLSIAEAQFFPFYVPKAIYLDDTPVGFLMYESLAEEGKPNDYNIFRFMVAEGYQQKGIRQPHDGSGTRGDPRPGKCAAGAYLLCR